MLRLLDLLGHFLSLEVFQPHPQGGLDGAREVSCPSITQGDLF